jgi:CRISPR/Cas system CSM-associated protein Csm2 small subunit
MTVDEFIAQYDDGMSQIGTNVKAELIDIARSRASFPKTRDQMRAKFYIDVVPVEIATPGDEGEVRPQMVGLQELEAHDVLVRDATRRKVEEAIESMIEAPRRQLADALAGLRDVITRNGKVSTKSFKPVYEAIRKIRAFEFACNAELMAEMQKLEGRMGITVAKTLDATTSAQSGFTGALDALMTEVADEEKAARDQQAFGAARQFRAIDLD